MLLDQHLPILALLFYVAGDLLAAIVDRDVMSRSAESVSSGIDRIGEDVIERVVDWQLPLDPQSFRTIGDGGQWDAFASEP